MDLDPEVFSNQLASLDMTFEKFFFATANQKIIYSTPDVNEGRAPGENKVFDVVNFLVGDTAETQGFQDKFVEELYPTLCALTFD